MYGVSITIKVECELISRDKNNPQKAVVQVKGGKSKTINALDYKSYVENNILLIKIIEFICKR